MSFTRIGEEIELGEIVEIDGNRYELVSELMMTNEYTTYRAIRNDSTLPVNLMIYHRRPYKVVGPSEPDNAIRGGQLAEFGKYTVKQLRKFLTEYRHLHNIKNSSKMRKNQLIDELTKKFVIIDGKIVMKGQEPQPTQPAPKPQKSQKRDALSKENLPKTVSDLYYKLLEEKKTKQLKHHGSFQEKRLNDAVKRIEARAKRQMGVIAEAQYKHQQLQLHPYKRKPPKTPPTPIPTPPVQPVNILIPRKKIK
jgi:hypothetical protein